MNNKRTTPKDESRKKMEEQTLCEVWEAQKMECKGGEEGGRTRRRKLNNAREEKSINIVKVIVQGHCLCTFRQGPFVEYDSGDGDVRGDDEGDTHTHTHTHIHTKTSRVFPKDVSMNQQVSVVRNILEAQGQTPPKG